MVITLSGLIVTQNGFKIKQLLLFFRALMRSFLCGCKKKRQIVNKLNIFLDSFTCEAIFYDATFASSVTTFILGYMFYKLDLFWYINVILQPLDYAIHFYTSNYVAACLYFIYATLFLQGI